MQKVRKQKKNPINLFQPSPKVRYAEKADFRTRSGRKIVYNSDVLDKK